MRLLANARAAGARLSGVTVTGLGLAISAGLLVAYVFALYQVINAAAASAARDPYGRPSVAPGPRPTDLPGVRISPVSARRIAN